MKLTSTPVKKLSPINHPLSARVSVPGSKSHTNRAALLAALVDGKTTLQNALFSEDSHYFASALKKLGFKVQSDPEDKTITIEGLGGHIPARRAELFIGNAGTAARFLTAFLTLGHGEYILDGVARMRQRPIGDLVVALNNLGAQVNGYSSESGSGETAVTTTGLPVSIEGHRSIYPPVSIQASGLAGGRTSIRGDLSSQYLSALLMVAPYAVEAVEITVEGALNSKPYIDLTLSVMADFGVQVQRKGYSHFQIHPGRYRSPGVYAIESDASAASYFFAAPAICGGWVEVANITQNARQGDIAFLDILSKMGCSVSETEGAIRVTAPHQLRGIVVNMSDISDTAITLAAIAPFADTPTTIRGIASSRVKETDRVAATCVELRRLGVSVDEHPDGMTIQPASDIQPAVIRTYNDHRIAMAFALVGLRVAGISIENPACVSKTFPNYFEVLACLQ